MDHYRYTVQGCNINRVVKPIGVRGLRENYTLVEEDTRRFGFQNDFSGELVFTNDEAEKDYDFFKDLNESIDKCTSLTLVIDRLCNNEYVAFRTAVLKLSEGNFDDDNCILNIKITVNSDYSCLDAEKETEINLLAGPFPKKNGQIFKGNNSIPGICNRRKL